MLLEFFTHEPSSESSNGLLALGPIPNCGEEGSVKVGNRGSMRGRFQGTRRDLDVPPPFLHLPIMRPHQHNAGLPEIAWCGDCCEHTRVAKQAATHRRSNVKKRIAILTATVAALTLSMPARSEDKPAQAPRHVRSESQTVTAKATVEAIDMKTRHVTLKNAQGKSFTIAADKQVKNLAQV